MKIQPVDYTTLVALVSALQRDWIPSRLEQIYQYDRHTICLALRTLEKRDWLWISWHPQAARIHMGDRPPATRIPLRLVSNYGISLKALRSLALNLFSRGKGCWICSLVSVQMIQRIAISM